MRQPRLVIFDCDGVLVDSEPISNGVLAQMLAEEGLAMTLAQSRGEFQGLTLAQVRNKVQARLGRELPAEWLDVYQERRAEVFRRELAPVPGAAEVVAAVIAGGREVCVASQGRLAKTAMTLGLTGLDELFPPSRRFSAEQVRAGKPEPDLFLLAAASVGVAAHECLVVEDTPLGVTAAVRAGMPVVGFAADSDAAALVRAGAAPVIERLHQLLDLLDAEG